MKRFVLRNLTDFFYDSYFSIYVGIHFYNLEYMNYYLYVFFFIYRGDRLSLFASISTSRKGILLFIFSS